MSKTIRIDRVQNFKELDQLREQRFLDVTQKNKDAVARKREKLTTSKGYYDEMIAQVEKDNVQLRHKPYSTDIHVIKRIWYLKGNVNS